MLTKEILKSVTGLTEEQVETIATLSQNDENSVIAAKIGEIHRQYDNDIESVTGLKKDGNTKTYQHLKNVLGDLKTKADEVETFKAKVEELKDQVKAGKVDEVMKQELADKTALVAQLQGQLDTVKADFTGQLEAEKQKAFDMKIDNEFATALTGLKFKDESLIPSNVRDTFVQAAKAKLLSEFKPDYIEDGNGGQKLVFRNKDGQVVNNPENKFNPFTPAELLAKEVSSILDVGRKQEGAGTKPHGNGQSSSIDLSGVKTQVEADKAIRSHLMSLGISKLSNEMTTKHAEIRQEMKVQELPVT